jgi:hypothetical protein
MAMKGWLITSCVPVPIPDWASNPPCARSDGPGNNEIDSRPLFRSGSGMQGENLIYLGGDEYWGLGFGSKIKSRAAWINLWYEATCAVDENKKPIPGTGREPKLLRWRRFPRTGLEN